MQRRRDAALVVVGETLPLADAQGLAEDFARRQRVVSLVDAEVPWRQQPASEKQTALIHKPGLRRRPDMTKGEATDLLAVVLGNWG